MRCSSALPGCDIVDNFTCDYVTVSPEAEYYISDAENFTVRISTCCIRHSS